MPIVKRFRKSKARRARRNPDDGGPSGTSVVQPIAEIGEFLLPAFGGFALTRFGTRAAATAISTRWPAYAKHAGALASLGSFGAAWLVSHRVKMLQRYTEPLTIGAGLAALQSLIQLYFPKLAWVVSDVTPDLTSSATTQISSASPTSDDYEVLDDNYGAQDWRQYNDAGDPGAYRTPQAANAQRQQAAAAASAADPNFDFSDDLDDMAVNAGSLSS